jgi:hypothetical protein
VHLDLGHEYWCARRADWEAAIRTQRHLAVAADAELRQRHPEQRFTPLRSAEPPAATDAQRAELSLAAGRRRFAERLAGRQSLMIPAEDPGYADLGASWAEATRSLHRDRLVSYRTAGPAPTG